MVKPAAERRNASVLSVLIHAELRRIGWALSLPAAIRIGMEMEGEKPWPAPICPAELVRIRPPSEPIDASISGALPAPCYRGRSNR